MTGLPETCWIPQGGRVGWSYAAWFEPHAPAPETWHPAVADAEEYILHTAIEQHPFFSHAAHDPAALAAWVTQELVVTGPFAQYMLIVGAGIENVHTRARLMKVVGGEHLGYRNGVATRAHPWLLNSLRESMGIPPSAVIPFEETEQFLAELYSDCCSDTLSGVAAIGVGNERLLIPEYTAVRAAFATGYPTADYATFLDANINEDREHAALMNEVAAILIADGADPDVYLDRARHAVDCRIQFYDKLLDRVTQTTFRW